MKSYLNAITENDLWRSILKAEHTNPDPKHPINIKPLLELNGLTARAGKKTLLSKVNLSLNSGDIMGLLGPNGAGKTTTLNCIVGLHSDYSGTVRINGLPASNPETRHWFGLAPDDLPLPESLTGSEILTLQRKIRSTDHSLDRQQELIDLICRKT